MLRELVESSEYQQPEFQIAARAGKRHYGQDRRFGSAEDAALLDGWIDRHWKERLDQRDDSSLLYRSRPDQVKMIMIDPKRLELGLVSGHSASAGACGYRTENRAERIEVGRHVKWKARYKKLAKRGVRNSRSV